MQFDFELYAVRAVYAVRDFDSKPHKTEVHFYAVLCGPCSLCSFIAKTAHAYMIHRINRTLTFAKQSAVETALEHCL